MGRFRNAAIRGEVSGPFRVGEIENCRGSGVEHWVGRASTLMLEVDEGRRGGGGVVEEGGIDRGGVFGLRRSRRAVDE